MIAVADSPLRSPRRRSPPPGLVLGAALVGLWITVVVSTVAAGTRAGSGSIGATGQLVAFCHLRLQADASGGTSWLELGPWIITPVMVLAMMLPATVPALDHVRRHSLRPRRARAVAEFLFAYTAVWTAFMTVAVLILEAARGWFAGWIPGHPTAAVGLAAAAVWQISVRRRRLLRGCRRSRPLAPRGRQATVDACVFGATYGLRCVGACWALMLLTMASGLTGLAALGAMAAVSLYLWVERTQPRRGRALARPVAVLLGLGAVASLVV